MFALLLVGCVTTTPETVPSMSSQFLCEMMGPMWVATPEEQRVVRGELDKRGIVCDYGRIVGYKNGKGPNENTKEGVSTGTGFFVKPDGTMLTAYHVVADKKKIEVHCSNKTWYQASLVSFSVGNDVALLKTNITNRKWIPVISTEFTNTGDKVYTVGYPVVEVLGLEPKYTDGVLSSKSGIKGDNSFMQITTPIQPGNSGGPLVLEGKGVIGVIVSTAAVAAFYNATNSLPQNVNWSTKSDYVGLLDSTLIQKPSNNLSIKDVIASTCLVKAE